MGRTAGTRNSGYEARRRAYVERVVPLLRTTAGAGAGLNRMADAAKVSAATLRHYFGSRDGLVAAYLEQCREDGEPHLAVARTSEAPFATSIPALAAFIVMGLGVPEVQEMHGIGLAEGLRDATLGPTYLETVLEPTLLAVETRLAAHMERGEMRRTDPRHAALQFVSPLLLGGLHQAGLGGCTVRPLDLDAFARRHAEDFVRLYGFTPTEAPAG